MTTLGSGSPNGSRELASIAARANVAETNWSLLASRARRRFKVRKPARRSAEPSPANRHRGHFRSEFHARGMLPTAGKFDQAQVRPAVVAPFVRRFHAHLVHHKDIPPAARRVQDPMSCGGREGRVFSPLSTASNCAPAQNAP